ncbi:MAG: RidA family protein [Gemmatimonadota bacterium]
MANTRAVHTERAPAAVGPYSQGVLAGEFFFSAGQVGLDPATGEFVGGDIVSQTRQVFRNLAAVLEAAGLSFRNVVKTNVFLADMSDFGVVNAIYAEHFEEPYPARSTVAAAELPKGARVEIDIVARTD